MRMSSKKGDQQHHEKPSLDELLIDEGSMIQMDLHVADKATCSNLEPLSPQLEGETFIRAAVREGDAFAETQVVESRSTSQDADSNTGVEHPLSSSALPALGQIGEEDSEDGNSSVYQSCGGAHSCGEHTQESPQKSFSFLVPPKPHREQSVTPTSHLNAASADDKLSCRSPSRQKVDSLSSPSKPSVPRLAPLRGPPPPRSPAAKVPCAAKGTATRSPVPHHGRADRAVSHPAQPNSFLERHNSPSFQNEGYCLTNSINQQYLVRSESRSRTPNPIKDQKALPSSGHKRGVLGIERPASSNSPRRAPAFSRFHTPPGVRPPTIGSSTKAGNPLRSDTPSRRRLSTHDLVLQKQKLSAEAKLSAQRPERCSAAEPVATQAGPTPSPAASRMEMARLPKTLPAMGELDTLEGEGLTPILKSLDVPVEMDLTPNLISIKAFTPQQQQPRGQSTAGKPLCCFSISYQHIL